MAKLIRPIAICIFYFDGKILAAPGYDKVTKKKYFRPLGGGIEFGEISRQALIREVKEELGAEIKSIKKIGLFENIFIYQGKPGHEIVFVYNAEFADQKYYQNEKIAMTEEGKKSEAVWIKIKDLARKNFLLYPVGLKELIFEEIKNN